MTHVNSFCIVEWLCQESIILLILGIYTIWLIELKILEILHAFLVYLSCNIDIIIIMTAIF